MKNHTDPEQIVRIIEKIERWEAPSPTEKILSRIIEALKIRKNEPVVIDKAFQNTLKKDLLIQYDELYQKKWWYEKIILVLRAPFFRLVVSFCFVFIVMIGVFDGLNLLPYSKKSSIIVNNAIMPWAPAGSSKLKSDDSDSFAPSATDAKKEQQESVARENKWMSFWKDQVNSKIMWVTHDSPDLNMTYPIAGIILLFVIIIWVVFVLKKKKK